MRLAKKTSIAAVALLNTVGLPGAAASVCPTSGICFWWGVPNSTVSTGSDNLYFQLNASTSYEWVGLGIGSKMAGSDMFVLYTDGNDNITLSTRHGSGHYMPKHVQRDDIELLPGSGISNGQMTANVRCSGGCKSLDLSSSGNWMAAWKHGSPLDSASTSAAISLHDGYKVFSVDLAQAAISSNSNPFSNAHNSSDTPNGGATTGGGGGGGWGNSNKKLVHAHGIVMTVVFIAGYPIGSMLMAIIGNWIVHASWQMLVFLGMWAGFGIGYIASPGYGGSFASTHTQLGVIVCALLGLQPFLGWLHHMYYAKHQRRGIVGHVHIWYGRSLIIIGIVNGYLGIRRMPAPSRLKQAYWIVAGVVLFLYLLSVALSIYRKRSHRKKVEAYGMSENASSIE